MNATSFAYLYFLSLSRWDNEYLCYLMLYAVLKTYFTELTVHFKLSLIKCYYILTISSFFLYASNSARPAFLLASLCSAIPEQAILEGESDTGWKWKLWSLFTTKNLFSPLTYLAKTKILDRAYRDIHGVKFPSYLIYLMDW